MDVFLWFPQVLEGRVTDEFHQWGIVPGAMFKYISFKPGFKQQKTKLILPAFGFIQKLDMILFLFLRMYVVEKNRQKGGVPLRYIFKLISDNNFFIFESCTHNKHSEMMPFSNMFYLKNH